MIAHLPAQRLVSTPVLASLVLALGIVLGLALMPRLLPVPRVGALLWDDYILAVSAIYQKDGDLGKAQERLAQLPTDDPNRSVTALASVYVPEADLGETAAYAVRDLASALTQRAFDSPPANAALQDTVVDQRTATLLVLARDKMTWVVVALLASVWTGTSILVGHRQARRAASHQLAPVIPVAKPQKPKAPAKVKQPRVSRRPSFTLRRRPSSPEVAAEAPVTLGFTYGGGNESVAEVAPIVDPRTRRLVAGCGLNSGPRASDEGEGFLGFVVWVHDGDENGSSQAVGLVTEWAGKHSADVVDAWMQKAHLSEVLVARPGFITSIGTKRTETALTITEVGYTRLGRQKQAAISRISVRLEVTMRQAAMEMAGGAGTVARTES